MKTFYIAARPSRRIKEVTELNEFLINQGLKSTLNWSANTINEEVKRPYKNHLKSSADIGDSMMRAVFSADVVILLHDIDLAAALMEYGIARYTAIENQDKLILIVKMGGRDSIFLHRQNIISFESIEQLKKWVIENF